MLGRFGIPQSISEPGMVNTVYEILARIGPCLTTALSAELVKAGLSPDAARKRVSRATGQGIARLDLRFPKRARFISLRSQVGTLTYWKALRSALVSGEGAYASAVSALIARGGIVPTNHFQIICGSPLRQKKHLSAEAVLGGLRKASLCEVTDFPSLGSCVRLKPELAGFESSIDDLQARLISEGVLLNAIKTWAERLGLVAWDKAQLRNGDGPVPVVGTFAWDLAGPSYTRPMRRFQRKELKPGFVACDIALGEEISPEGLMPFIGKCDTLSRALEDTPILYMFVASGYHKKAFEKAKAEGVIPATPESLFGKEVAEGLQELQRVLVGAARAIRSQEGLDLAAFDRVFSKLAKLEGAAGNLRGACFELIVAELFRIDGARVYLNKIFTSESGEKAEVDVMVERESQRTITCIECKGMHAGSKVSDDEIDTWLYKRIPRVRSDISRDPERNRYTLTFELWTTGELSEMARSKIENLGSRVSSTKYTIGILDAHRVMDIVNRIANPTLTKLVQQHYVGHPLARS